MAATESSRNRLQVQAEKLSNLFQSRPSIAARVLQVKDETTLEAFASRLEAEVTTRERTRKRRWLENCATASAILKTYVGIAEIAKAVDTTAGGLAYGSISFLLTVSMATSLPSSTGAFRQALTVLSAS